MTSSAIIQDLIAARLDRVREASEKRDVDELMSWYSKDARFSHVCANESRIAIQFGIANSNGSQ